MNQANRYLTNMCFDFGNKSQCSKSVISFTLNPLPLTLLDSKTIKSSDIENNKTIENT